MAPQRTEFGFDEPISPAKWYLGLCLIVISVILKVNWLGAWLQIFITTRTRDRHWKPPNNPSTKRIMQVDDDHWEDQSFRGSMPYVEDDHYCEYIRSTVYLRTLKPYCFLLFVLPIDACYSFAISIAAVGNTSTRWTAPFVGSIIACSLVVFIVVLDNFIGGFKRLVWRNCVGPEINEDKWLLAFKYRDLNGYRLRLHEFDKNPWNLGPMENFRQVFGQHWWTWPFFWWTSETVLRYGDYSDRDLPYAEFVTREFTDQIMPRLAGVAIDRPTPSLGGEGLNRRQSTHSDTEYRSQQRPGDTPTSHVGIITTRYEGGNIRRLVQGRSSGHDLGL